MCFTRLSFVSWSYVPPSVLIALSRAALFSQQERRLHAGGSTQMLPHLMQEAGLLDNDDSDDDEEMEEGEEERPVPGRVSELAVVQSLTAAQRAEYAALLAEDEKAGWRLEPSPVARRAFVPPQARPRPVLHGCSTPLEFFHALLPVSVFADMAERMNALAASQRGEENAGASSPGSASPAAEEQKAQPAWTDTSTEELLALIGCFVCLTMCELEVDRLEDCWPGLGPAFLFDTFPRERFFQLLRCFNMADAAHPAAVDDPRGRLARVRDVLELVGRRCQDAHYPSQHLCIDQAVLAVNAEDALTEIESRSRSRRGNRKNNLKLWLLVESRTGYVLDVRLRDSSGGKKADSEPSQLVVNELVQALDEQRWHVIAMDGRLSSVSLLESLQARGFYAVASTGRGITGFPSSLAFISGHIADGQWLCRQRGDLTAVSCVDRGEPTDLLSTYCDASTEVRGERGLRYPEAVVEHFKWTRWVRGADRSAHRDSPSVSARKTRRWTRLSWFVLHVCVGNAYVLYEQHRAATEQSASSPTDFRCALMRALRQRPAARAPQHIPQMGRPQPAPCVVCAEEPRLSTGQQQPRTTEGCETCDVAVHIEDCWAKHLTHGSEEDEPELS